VAADRNHVAMRSGGGGRRWVPADRLRRQMSQADFSWKLEAGAEPMTRTRGKSQGIARHLDS